MWLFDWIYSIYLKLFPPKLKTSKLLIIGLDNAGKTTMLNSIKTGKFEKCEKTSTYNIENIQIGGVSISAYDLGGHEIARQSWKDYYADCDGIVFLIDAACPSRFKESRVELDAILNDKFLAFIPILILANKVDVAGAVSYIDIVSSFGLKDLCDPNDFSPEERPVYLAMSSIRQQFGFVQGFKWISHFV